MSAKPGGSFATLLMTGPLAAIPFMAVFGVPEFTPVVARTGPAEEDVRRQPQTADDTDDETIDSQKADESSAPRPGLTLAADDRSSTEPGPSSRPSGRSDQSQPSSDGHAIGPNRQRAAVADEGSPHAFSTPVTDDRAERPRPEQVQPAPPSGKPDGIATSPKDTHAPRSWENAAQRLQEMGIDDYRLERGHQSDSYLFICQFAPGRDARIIQRFEAEAEQPIQAVQQVLAQIDHWEQLSRSESVASR